MLMGEDRTLQVAAQTPHLGRIILSAYLIDAGLPHDALTVSKYLQKPKLQSNYLLLDIQNERSMIYLRVWKINIP